jgi:hypothetical protein
VDARKADGFEVTAACAAAGVSTSAYYAWAAEGRLEAGVRMQRDAALLAEIRASHRRRRSLTKSDETAAPLPDLVGRLFDPDHTDVTWVGDVERHEALQDRAVVKGHRLRALAGAC